MSIVALIIMFNFALYTGVIFGVKVFKIDSQNKFNNSNSILICYPLSSQQMKIAIIVDLLNSTILPGLLMIVNTGLLVFALYKSICKFFHRNPTKQVKLRKKRYPICNFMYFA